MPTKTALSLPSWALERKYKERLTGQGKDRESSLTSYWHGQYRLNLGNLIYYQSNQDSCILKNVAIWGFFAFSDMLRKLQSVTQTTKVLSAFDLIKKNQQPFAFLIK